MGSALKEGWTYASKAETSLLRRAFYAGLWSLSPGDMKADLRAAHERAADHPDVRYNEQVNRENDCRRKEGLILLGFRGQVIAGRVGTILTRMFL